MAGWLFSLADSMTALACFALGLVVLLVVEFVRVPFVVHALVASVIAVPAMVLFVGLGAVLTLLGRDPTLTDRTLIWELLISLAPNTQIGAGFENFWLGPRLIRIWSLYTWQPNQAHNGYVEIFLNLGWIGIGLIAILLSVGYHTVATGLRRSPSTGNLMLAYFVVAVVYNFTEAALFRMMTPTWIALLLAITRVPGMERPKQQSYLRRRAGRLMFPTPWGATTRYANPR
jgi:O-antigen ligase